MLKRIVSYISISISMSSERFITSSVLDIGGIRYSNITLLGEGTHAQAYHCINDQSDREATLRIEKIQG